MTQINRATNNFPKKICEYFFNKNKTFLSIFFLLLITIFFTNNYYHFGDNNHVEQLPHIFSKLDTKYLVQDQFVQYTRDTNPRYYYSSVLALINIFFTQEKYFYIVTLILNFGINLVTFLTVKLLIRDSVFPLMCVIALMNFTQANLGGAGMVNDYYLVPQLMSMPLILFAYYFSMKGKYFTVLFLSLLSLPIQPVLTIISLFPIVGNLLLNKHLSNKYFKVFVIFFLNSILIYLLFLKYQNNFVIDNQLYLYIIAWFRHPHHYIPSSFPKNDYIEFIAITLISFISLFFLTKNTKDKSVYKYFLYSIVISILLIICGYVFAEIIPIESIIKLQTFRIVFLIRWISLMLISITFYKIITKYSNSKFTYIIYMFFVYLILIKGIININNIIQPSYHYHIATEKEAIYNYISNSTNINTLFLTPPDFGDMRIYPKRAIIVDYKSFP
ncbi:MAG: DUF6798 domain-containing protein, partial [Candidatus Shapirobacteria bacterium]